MNENTAELLNLLESGNKRERRSAIDGLKKIGKPASLQLLNILNSENPDIRDGAAEILGSYSEGDIDTFLKLLASGKKNARDGAARTIAYIIGNGGKITTPLSKMIRDGTPEARKGAAISIGYIHNPKADFVNMLLYMLKDDDREVRKQAAESLKKLNWNSVNPVEMAFFYMADEDWDKLGKSGPFALEAVKFGLKNADSEVRIKLAGILAGTKGNESKKILLSILADPDKKVKLAAIDAVAETRDPELMNYLAGAMYDRDYDVQVETSWALRKAGWRPASYNEKVRALILQGDLREIELMGRTALTPLIENLGDTDPNIRKNAVKVLYSIGKPAYEALRQAENKSSPEIREGIQEALEYFSTNEKESAEKTGSDSATESEIREYNSRDYWHHAFIENGYNQEMAERFSASLSGEDDIIRITAIENLKGHGKRAIPIMILLLNDEKENVKTVAIESLGDLYAKDAIESLVKTIEDEHHEVRRASAYALGKIRDKGTLPVLVRHFADPEETVRNECSESVAKMGNIALPFIENLVSHNDPDVRIASLRALGGISDPSGIPFGTKALNDSEYNVRIEAMDALVRISGFMFNFLMNEIQRVSIQGTKMEKLGMLSVLSRLQDLKIVPVVKRFLADDDEEVRRNASEILEVYRKREIKKEKDRIREYSRETADLLKRKLSLKEIDSLLDRLIGADDFATMEILGKKLSQNEIEDLIKGLKAKKGDTSKVLGKRLSQDEIDELIHRSAYVSNKNTTELLGKKLNQDEIDDLIKRASSEKEENAAKDIKKQLTQNEIDDLIKKELALKKKAAMEVSMLIVGLKSSDPAAESSSTAKIIKIGEPAVEPLLSFMNNAEPEFQAKTAEILIKIGKPGIRGMIRTLNYGRTEMRVVIARTILKSKDPEAVNAVYDRIKSEKNPEVRKALILAFTKDSKDKRIPDALHSALADPDPGVKTLAVRLLAKIKDERAIGPLVSVLNYSEDTLADLASDSLVGYGKAAQPALLKELKGNGSDQFRERIAATMDKMQFKPADSRDIAWYFAAKGRWSELEKSGDYALEPLSQIIGNPYSKKRTDALKTLIGIGGTKVLPSLSNAVFDIDEDISGTARQGILDMGRSVIPALTEIASKEKDAGRQRELESIIREIDQKDLIKKSIEAGDWNALAGAGPMAIKYISERTNSADPETKRQMISVISRIGGEEAVCPLSEMLFDNDERIAVTARHGLLNTGGEAIPELEKICRQTSNPARREALKFLIREISKEEEIATLVKEKRWIELQLKGEDAIDMISQLLEDPNPENRMGATKVFAGIDDISAVRPLLHSLFDTDPEIVTIASSALKKRGKTIIPVISVAIIKEKNPAKKKALADLIREMESGGS
ncbi:HEAT repeat domain-containing protein [Methanolacinia paynteri]|uniref:HEAT repeat domain-containing protein n=1 Tax=Methanolacinia paynteri TaxID=230356 RepID=UPI00064F6191|nr:HEAT repeat domain-containing protein [Methanolacinia paynteri]